MRTTLNEAGIIVPPANMTTARERVQTCETEMRHIFEQLIGNVMTETLGWRERARAKYRAFDKEREQLLKWIRDKEREEVHDIILWCSRVLEDDADCVGLDMSETLLLERCKKFLNQ